MILKKIVEYAGVFENGEDCYISLIRFHDRDARLSYADHSVINDVITNG